jgi:hypothetical protein
VLTLDRIVSLRDYQDYASAFPGVAKALATWYWDGQRRGVFVTVAGPRGVAIDDGGMLQRNLLTAMHNIGDPLIPLQVRSYLKQLFRVAATVKIDPAYLEDQVGAALDAALRAAFSFDTRTFGQSVTLSEVIAVMQAVSGVIGVTGISFNRSYPLQFDPVHLNGETFVLTASVPSAGSGAGVSAAELLTLDPAPPALTIIM